MAETNLIEDLRELAFLRGIAEEYLQQIAQIAKRTDVPAGKTIFREGDPALDIYLIIRGNVSLEICAPGVGCKRILTLGEGELVGCSPLLEQTRLMATARALGPTQLAQISGSQILALCEHDPRFGYDFMRQVVLALAKRLHAARIQLLDVCGDAMPSVGDRSN